jgi:hypothetical protein
MLQYGRPPLGLKSKSVCPGLFVGKAKSVP